jgi:hypothetical protein
VHSLSTGIECLLFLRFRDCPVEGNDGQSTPRKSSAAVAYPTQPVVQIVCSQGASMVNNACYWLLKGARIGKILLVMQLQILLI